MMAIKLKLRAPDEHAAASLAFFRMLSGIIFLVIPLRFMMNGWVERYFTEPRIFFPYWGFSWVQPLPGAWMYLPYIGMALAAVLVIAGWHFRYAIAGYLLLFTYTEVVDITNYLNHHYLIFLLCILMFFLPMDADYSLAAKRKGVAMGSVRVPFNFVRLLQLQIGLVYFLAGIAKIKYSWLIEAQPLKIWLAANSGLPLIGGLLGIPVMAWVFSWGAMIFDISVPFLLSYRKTRIPAYLLIIIFHTLTGFMFYIGLFPLIMTCFALIFFSGEWHQKLLAWIFGKSSAVSTQATGQYPPVFRVALFLFFAIQFLLPFRYLLYQGNVLWTEQGFRYAWNVMLMEKNGITEFYLKDRVTGKQKTVLPERYLSRQQLRMMNTQPDMILRFAQQLALLHRQQTGHPASVYVSSYASLNGKGSRMLINPDVDLAAETDGLCEKKWIMPL